MRVLVTGGTGFIGRRTVQHLVAWGHQVRCVVRPTSDLRPIQPFPVEIWRGDVTDASSLTGAADDIDSVVHLAGIIRESGDATFHRVHVEGARHLVAAGRAADIQHFIFLSGVGARPDRRHPYLMTKWQAEEIVQSGGIPWTVIRSSVVFGPGDGFLTQLADVVRHPPMGGRTFSPLVPVLGSGRTLFQPIHVEDLARCLRRAVEDPALRGSLHEVGGPHTHTYEDLVDLVMARTRVHRPKLHIPLPLVRPAVNIMARVLPNPPLTPTQLAMLELDNVPRSNAIESAFGVTPSSLEEKLDYL